MRSATCIAASRIVDCFTLHRDAIIEASNSCSVLRSSIEEVMFLKIVSAEYPHEVRRRPDIEKRIREKTAELMKQAEDKRKSLAGGKERSISNIKLEKKIGKGASGEVWFGLDENGRPCAVKRIPTHGMSSRNVMQVQQEASLLEVLSHPNVVESYGTFADLANGMIHIVLEYLPMGSLQSQLRRLGPFKEAQARAYTKQLLCGLQYLHSRSILHRDIKPANALISAKGIVKLADFGICLQTLALRTLTLTGTPAYLAPEVLELGTYSVASDVWAVGCTLLELITGYPPWSDQVSTAEITALIFRIGIRKVPTIPMCVDDFVEDGVTHPSEGISRPLHNLLLRMLNPDPLARGTCDELLQSEWFTVDADALPKAALRPRNDLLGEHPPTVTTSNNVVVLDNASFDTTYIVTSDGHMDASTEESTEVKQPSSLSEAQSSR